MITRIVQADEEGIRLAAGLLRSGEVVAFPTETVYGLGANALGADAVQKIFTAKGRPSNNPLIVHVSSVEQARELVTEWPEAAEKLTQALWPGPLTIVLPKSDIVPGITTAGGNTVGVRLPAHPVARALIEACGFPLAAPSANRSNYISPTTAEHVTRSLEGRIPLVLDGGPCDRGIESTVVDLSGGNVRILRPGLVSAEDVTRILGTKQELDSGADQAWILKTLPENDGGHTKPAALASPGQLPKHYAPHTPLHLVNGYSFMEEINKVSGASETAPRLAVIACAEALRKIQETACREKFLFIEMPDDPAGYARCLFSALHELDLVELDGIYCVMPPDEPDWYGVLDRLRRAAHK